ncbi:DUF669 domain-containing protein, partial [Endozoicomonas sp. ALB115]|uniref:DUF669 domain-containing protein n=1 Tax=Endozoicomonas sp. ALB115 TaxID=3403074 RepID=UPI003BB49DA4
MAGLGFKANDYSPAQGFEPLPNGDYVAMITDAEMKTTKAGNGQFLKLTWTVMDGQYSGRKVWSNHNIINLNETAQKIAREEISAIAHAIGRPEAGTTEELVNIPCRITLKIRQEAGRDPSNEIKKWEAIGQATFPTHAQPAPQPAAAPAAPAPGVAPAAT